MIKRIICKLCMKHIIILMIFFVSISLILVSCAIMGDIELTFEESSKTYELEYQADDLKGCNIKSIIL